MKEDIKKYIYPLLLVLIISAVILLQFYNWSQYRLTIEDSNYYFLLLSSIVMAFVVLLLSITKETRVGVSDIWVGVFALYLFINSYFHNSLDSNEFRMALSYIMFYLWFRLIFKRVDKMVDYSEIIIMIAGICQSILAMKQIYGLEYSNHARYAMTGSFYNPGPCGIFISAVMVLSIAHVKRCNIEFSSDKKLKNYLTFDCLRYAVALIALITTVIVIVPTMSRAGWVGAIVALSLVYRVDIINFLDSICRRLKMSRNKVYIVIAAMILSFLICIYLIKQGSADGRLFIWRNVIAAYVDSPIFGVGVDGFSESYSAAQYQYFLNHDVLLFHDKNIDVVGVPSSAFNEILALLLLLGSVGMLLGCYILYRKFKNGIKRGEPLLFMGISILISSLFSYTFYIPVSSILFVISLASIDDEKRIKCSRFLAPISVLTLMIMSIYVNRNIFNELDAKCEWKECSAFYLMKDYETTVKEYADLVPYFRDNHEFMFEYGHSLNKIGRYKESNKILEEGEKHSTDPMFQTIIGNNYAALNEIEKSEKAYLKAYYLCPNRVYPLYLLTKLFYNNKNIEKTKYYGNIFNNKKIKIPSQAVDDMQKEIIELLNDI